MWLAATRFDIVTSIMALCELPRNAGLAAPVPRSWMAGQGMWRGSTTQCTRVKYRAGRVEFPTPNNTPALMHNKALSHSSCILDRKGLVIH